jgi:hypothetical protein
MASRKSYERADSEMQRPGKEGAESRVDMPELVRLATLAASSRNTQPWKFKIDRDSITVLPRAIPIRQCTKTPYEGGRLPSEELRLLEGCGQGAGVRTMILTDRAQIEAAIEYVTRGNHAQLSDPAFLEELIS